MAWCEHGGFVAVDGDEMREVAPNGRVLWEMPRAQAIDEFAAPARPGELLVLRQNRLTLRDRFGRQLWQYEQLFHDVRSAQMIAPKRYLVVDQHAVHIIDQDGGKPVTVAGLSSATRVWYSKDGPWMIEDNQPILYFPKTGKRVNLPRH
jgi:hypothetical protein